MCSLNFEHSVLITLGKNNLTLFTESVAFFLKVFNCAYSSADLFVPTKDRNE